MSTSGEIIINNQIFTLCNDPVESDMEQLHANVKNDKRFHTHGEYDKPGIEINLLLKDSKGKVQGGVIASTVFRVMHLEVLWVAELYHRRGYGAQLVLGAEQIGLGSGCLTAQTWTFSFQGPHFYPAIGYKPIGVYDGYPNGITEHAFMKRLEENQEIKRKFGISDARGMYLDTKLTEEDAKILHQGLHQHVVLHVGDGYKGIKIRLVVKDKEGKLVGGLSAWTTLQNLIFEHLWVDEKFRRQGLGKKLVLEVDEIARENGCIASQAYCFSFQALGFMEKIGYKVLGVSDGYPAPFHEFYLIKKYAP